jgi:3-hydroxyacyl-[acyl-carrier-protein] dehydratase
MTPGPNERQVSIEEIVKLLPHRFPFLLVDRVISLEPGKSIVAIKNVSCNEAFFQGHFPEIKIMPGVLIIEALAQAGGVLLYHSFTEPRKKLVVLSKIKNIKFRRSVVPGDQLRLEVEVTKVRSKFAAIRGRALVDGEVAAEGEISAGIIDLAEDNEPR